MSDMEKKTSGEVAEASKEAIKAVEAMKAAQSQALEEGTVYITAGVEWRRAMKTVEEEVEKELSKANEVIADILTKEKAKVRESLQKEFAEKEKQMISEHKEETEQLKKEHEAELEKMKKLYAEQIEETASAFKDKMAALRKEIDQHKEQIEVLMLHIDDPFVLQEVQMKQSQPDETEEK